MSVKFKQLIPISNIMQVNLMLWHDYSVNIIASFSFSIDQYNQIIIMIMIYSRVIAQCTTTSTSTS